MLRISYIALQNTHYLQLVDAQLNPNNINKI